MGGYAASRFLSSVFEKGGMPAFLIVIVVLCFIGGLYWVGKYFVELAKEKAETSREMRQNLQTQNNLLVEKLEKMTDEITSNNGKFAEIFAERSANDHRFQAQTIETQRAIQESCKQNTALAGEIVKKMAELSGWIQGHGAA